MAGARPKGFRLLAAALSTRTSASMLAFGFSSGLPFALLIGTLNAWLGEAKVNLATIGVLSWISLASAFKFLWSPLVDRAALPGIGRLGRRKGWIVACQAVLVAVLVGLALTDPATTIGRFAILAVIGAIAFATQDIAIDAWRIDLASEATPVELLSAIYQFGYRVASIVGGAIALSLAQHSSWPATYMVMAVLMALVLAAGLAAPDTQRPPRGAAAAALAEPGEVIARVRGVALLVVTVAWLWAIVSLGAFMIRVVTVPAGTKPPSSADFLKVYGPAIVVATVLLPLAIAAIANWLKAHGHAVQAVPSVAVSKARIAADHLYTALIAPLADLAQRLGWGVLLVIGLILTYALCYNVWASFAYPFYLGTPHYLGSLNYTKDEVAFASKVFGIVMSILGVSLGGYLFAKIGRMPTVLIGAALPIFGNFVYADLADGSPHIDAVLHAFGVGGDLHMPRLLLAIVYENITTGLALAAYVAYLSSIASKRFPAVQYALLSSLTFLIGSLGKGVVGEMIEKQGYAVVFREVAVVGLLAIVFVLLEWVRSARTARVSEIGGTGEAA